MAAETMQASRISHAAHLDTLMLRKASKGTLQGLGLTVPIEKSVPHLAALQMKARWANRARTLLRASLFASALLLDASSSVLRQGRESAQTSAGAAYLLEQLLCLLKIAHSALSCSLRK